ncbi:6-bladed beta-propeller [Desulforhopalus sp. IMCC35007]|nr:6-bladed beta-propeller [Desulforhopalus sp. IMCC35007]
MSRIVHFYYLSKGRRILFLLLSFFCLLLIGGCAGDKQVAREIVFYPEPPERPRLQFLTTISSERNLESKSSAFQQFLLGPNLAADVIGRPYDVGSSPGKIYLVDREHDKILIVDLINQNFSGLHDSRRGAFRAPSGIWVTGDDVKYIADMGRKQVVVYGSGNEFLRAYGNEKLLEKPVDVAVHGERVYVCDMGRHQVIVFDKNSGTPVKYIGMIGAGEGQLYRPTYITVDVQGNLFVNDTFNFRIQQFDSEGKFIQTIGFHGDQHGAMARPKGLDIDREGHLYIADAAFEHVQIFNDEGRLLLFFGGPGIGPGNMYLPAGVHIDYDNVEFFTSYADKEFKVKYLLYVCNMSGPNKLNVYGYGDWLGD